MAVTELNFTECGGGYEAFATVYADYNVRVERKDKGTVKIYQSTIEGREPVRRFATEGIVGNIWEEDFDNCVYPKYLRIVSSSEVEKGWVKEKEE